MQKTEIKESGKYLSVMNILVVCAAGMSSSALVAKMRSRIAERGLENMKVGSCASFELDTYALQADVILFGPQLSFMAQEKENKYHARMLVIDQRAYSLQDADAVIDQVLNPEKVTVEQKTVHNQKFISLIHSLGGAIRSNAVVSTLTEAMAMALPVSMAGAVLTLLKNLPFPGYEDWLAGTGAGALLNLGTDMTIGCISIYLCVTIAISASHRRNIRSAGAVMAVLAGFLMFSIKPEAGRIDMQYFGYRGMFTAMLSGIVLSFLFLYLTEKSKFRIEMQAIPERVRSSFLALVPFLVCIIFCLLITALIRVLGYDSLTHMIEIGLQNRIARFISNSTASFIFLMIITSALWFFGIHGGHIVSVFTDPVYLSLSMENIAAINAGRLPQNLVNSGLTYIFMFGGIGSTLALSFLCLRFAKSEKFRTIGKISLPMGIFFINEPVLFGIPIILNPFMLIPLIFVPLISGILTIMLMKSGILPYAAGYPIPWTTPPVLSGFIQGGWRLALWQMILLVLQTGLWYPFFRAADGKELESENGSSE